VFGAVGLTSSAGVAGWVEYLLLRTTMEKRIGKVLVETGYYFRLWCAALVSGVMSLLAFHLALPLLHGIVVLRASLQPIFDGGAVLVVFGAIYVPATSLLGIEEARRLLGRARA
jgi:putative peptidoglycan lipid II flippase